MEPLSLVFMLPLTKGLKSVFARMENDPQYECHELDDPIEAGQILSMAPGGILFCSDAKKMIRFFEKYEKLTKDNKYKTILLSGKPVPSKEQGFLNSKNINDIMTEPVSDKAINTKVDYYLKNIKSSLQAAQLIKDRKASENKVEAIVKKTSDQVIAGAHDSAVDHEQMVVKKKGNFFQEAAQKLGSLLTSKNNKDHSSVNDEASQGTENSSSLQNSATSTTPSLINRLAQPPSELHQDALSQNQQKKKLNLFTDESLDQTPEQITSHESPENVPSATDAQKKRLNLFTDDHHTDEVTNLNQSPETPIESEADRKKRLNLFLNQGGPDSQSLQNLATKEQQLRQKKDPGAPIAINNDQHPSDLSQDAPPSEGYENNVNPELLRDTSIQNNVQPELKSNTEYSKKESFDEQEKNYDQKESDPSQKGAALQGPSQGLAQSEQKNTDPLSKNKIESTSSAPKLGSAVDNIGHEIDSNIYGKEKGSDLLQGSLNTPEKSLGPRLEGSISSTEKGSDPLQGSITSPEKSIGPKLSGTINTPEPSIGKKLEGSTSQTQGSTDYNSSPKLQDSAIKGLNNASAKTAEHSLQQSASDATHNDPAKTATKAALKTVTPTLKQEDAAFLDELYQAKEIAKVLHEPHLKPAEGQSPDTLDSSTATSSPTTIKGAHGEVVTIAPLNFDDVLKIDVDTKNPVIHADLCGNDMALILLYKLSPIPQTIEEQQFAFSYIAKKIFEIYRGLTTFYLFDPKTNYTILHSSHNEKPHLVEPLGFDTIENYFKKNQKTWEGLRYVTLKDESLKSDVFEMVYPFREGKKILGFGIVHCYKYITDQHQVANIEMLLELLRGYYIRHHKIMPGKGKAEKVVPIVDDTEKKDQSFFGSILGLVKKISGKTADTDDESSEKKDAPKDLKKEKEKLKDQAKSKKKGAAA